MHVFDRCLSEKCSLDIESHFMRIKNRKNPKRKQMITLSVPIKKQNETMWKNKTELSEEI